MNIPISLRSLQKALESTGGRIVLGGRDRLVFLLILVFWFAAVALIGLFSVMAVTIQGGWEILPFPASLLAVMTAWCYLLGGWSSRLTLDIPSRTYLHEYGLYPFITRRQGSLDAFDHVSLARQKRMNGGGGTYYVSLLVLVWKESAPMPARGRKPAPARGPITLWISPQLTENRADLWRLATMLAQTLGLSLQDDSR